MRPVLIHVVAVQHCNVDEGLDGKINEDDEDEENIDYKNLIRGKDEFTTLTHHPHGIHKL